MSLTSKCTDTLYIGVRVRKCRYFRPSLYGVVVSGPGCVQDNSYCADFMSEHRNVSFDDCRQKCGENAVCEWISWQRGGNICYLHETCFQKNKVGGWVTSPMKCPRPGFGCYFDDWKIPETGENVAGLPGPRVTDVFECQEKCRENEKCNYFTLVYSETDVETRKCQLFAKNDGWSASLNHVSGYRDCPSTHSFIIKSLLYCTLYD